MIRLHKCGFFVRGSVKQPNGESAQYLQLVTGWMKTFRSSDRFLVRIGFFRNETSGRWYIAELDSGLNCGDSETLKGAKQLVKERIDAIAERMQKPEYVRTMHKFEFCVQFGEVDEHGRKIFEDHPNS